MGTALALRWAADGHDVLLGSRDRAKAARAAASAIGSVRTGSADDAAAFGDAVLYTVRKVLPSRLLGNPAALDGKILIDCNNSDVLGIEAPDPKNRPGIHFETPSLSLAEQMQADVPEAVVVKAFNTIPAQLLAIDRAELARQTISAFVCSDSDDARRLVSGLAEELGFVTVDCGGLDRANLLETLADLLRLQIIEGGHGPYTSLSLLKIPR